MNMKLCKACNNHKTTENFSSSRILKDGLCSICRSCDSERGKRYSAMHPERERLRRKRWYTKNRARRLKVSAAWTADNQDRRRNAWLLRVHSITLLEYNKLLVKQDYKCAICETPACSLDQRLFVDHDHSCCPNSRHHCNKCIRGLLCFKCNRAIGLLDDSHGNAQRAANYLANKTKVCD